MADVALAYNAAYKAGDYEGMCRFFHPDFRFTDPAYGALSRKRSRAMFALFCDTRDRTKQELNVVERPTPSEKKRKSADGGADWYQLVYTADYVFGPDARPVHNRITSNLEIVEGKIRSQIDEFGMVQWAKQAIGWGAVIVVAVSPGVIRTKANARLQAWIEEKGRQDEFDDDDD